MIINVGLSRTGTKSFAEAMKILGYNAVHLPTKEQLLNADDGDVFSDIPCIAYFEVLTKLYDLTIIATVREYRTWLVSCLNHFKPTNNAYFLELRRIVYGDVYPYHTKTFKVTYHRHLDWIAELRGNCTLLPLESPNKWQIVCDLFDKPLPEVEYPHL